MTHHVVIEFVNFSEMHRLKCNLGDSVVQWLVLWSSFQQVQVFVPAGVILIRSCVSLSECLIPPTEV